MNCLTGIGNIFIGNQAGLDETSNNKLYITNSGTTATNSFLYGEMAGAITKLYLGAIAAASDGTTRDTQFMLRNHYWNGSASTDWIYMVYHDMQAAPTPKSQVLHSINAVNVLGLENNNGAAKVLLPLNMESIAEGTGLAFTSLETSGVAISLKVYNTATSGYVTPLAINSGDTADMAISFSGGRISFFGAAAVLQQTKAAHNNWAAIGDVVSALVNLGLLDAA
jgi:hypothetical protein